MEETIVKLSKNNETREHINDQMIAEAMGLPQFLYEKLNDKIRSYHPMETISSSATWVPGGTFQTEEDMLDYANRESLRRQYELKKKENEQAAAELHSRQSTIDPRDVLTVEEYNVYAMLDQRNEDGHWTPMRLSFIFRVPEQTINDLYRSAINKLQDARKALPQREKLKPVNFVSRTRTRSSKTPLDTFIMKRKRRVFSRRA